MSPLCSFTKRSCLHFLNPSSCSPSPMARAGSTAKLMSGLNVMGVNPSKLRMHMALCNGMASWGCNFLNSTAEQKDLCLKNYYRHIERVQQVIPAQRLLVYNWSDGWAPLCHCLGKPIPDVPFPHEDFVMTDLTKRVIGTIRQELG